MKKRYRVGVRFPWPFSNAGIFVVWASDKVAQDISGAVNVLQMVLNATGDSNAQRLASMLVFEAA